MIKTQELDKIQNEAARIATVATRLVSIRALCKKIGWDSLEKRRSNHKLTLFYKMTHNLAPLFMSMKNSIPGLSEPKKAEFLDIFLYL